MRLEELVAAIDTQTALVAVMLANNETGVVQRLAPVAAAARAAGAVFHTDAAQSVGKVPLHVRELGVALLSVAGHKLCAPKGVGALYVRRGTPLVPLLFGAGHERGIRPGTENMACERAGLDLEAEGVRIRTLRGTVRLTLGRRTSDDDVEYAAAALSRAWARASRSAVEAIGADPPSPPDQASSEPSPVRR